MLSFDSFLIDEHKVNTLFCNFQIFLQVFSKIKKQQVETCRLNQLKMKKTALFKHYERKQR